MRPYPYPLRWRLPYGQWTCADGRIVLFDRKYDPIAEKYPDQPARLVEPGEWVKYIDTSYLYNERTPEYLKNKAARQALTEWNILDVALSRAKELRKINHKIASPV